MGGKYGDNHLTPEERNGFNAEGVSSAEDLDDLGMTADYQGIDLQEGELPSQRKRSFEPELEDDDDLDFRLNPDLLDKTNDPVKLYLRQMGSVPLLNRQQEIDIAKRFERGHLRVLKAISRCPFVIREVMAMGTDLD